MCRACHNICIIYRVLVETCCNQSCDMRHVYHEEGAYFICDLTEDIKADLSRISGRTGNDQLWLVLVCQFSYVVVIYGFRLRIQSVCYKVIRLSGNVDRGSMGQMTAVGQIHAQHCIAIFEDCLVYSSISVGTGMRLHVSMFCTKDLLGTIYRHLFYFVYEFASAIVSLSRVAFCILVGQRASHSFHDLIIYKVLGCDHFDFGFLTIDFTFHCCRYVRISFFQIVKVHFPLLCISQFM